jgi:predicted  nucleic acid-binding Zn-ribbon protein
VRIEDLLVDRSAWRFLCEGDAPTCFEETRSLAVTIYREAKKLKDKTVEEREQAEQILQRAEALLAEATVKLGECRQLEGRVSATEKRISSALEQAKKAGWLKRLLGKF